MASQVLSAKGGADVGRGAGPFPVADPHAISTPAVASGSSVLASERYEMALQDLSSLLSKNAEGVPEEFKVKELERPTVSFDQWADLPVIDFSELYTDEASLVRKIGEALREWGFFQLINHSVPLDKINAFRGEAYKFFAMPPEEKNKMIQDKNFCQYRANHLDTKLGHTNLLWAESLWFKYKPVFNMDELIEKVWPEGNPDMRNRTIDFAQSTQDLGDKLLELFALSLGLERDTYSKHFVDTRALFLRWNYYPPCPDPSAALGIKGHTDPFVFTLVQQDDVGGLQIKKNGVWLGVKPLKDAFVVNVGDILQAWTNDRYKSVEHQVVVNKEKVRLSVAAFTNLGKPNFIVKAPPQLVDADHPPVYRPFMFKEFLQLKYRPKSEDMNVPIGKGLQVLDYLKLKPSKL